MEKPMKITDILRKLADELDAIESVKAVQQDKSEPEEAPLDTMVPPLQQKMELLKRSVGIDNVFDGTSIDKAGQGQDELEAIKKNAGISPNTTAIMTLADDEPLDE